MRNECRLLFFFLQICWVCVFPPPSPLSPSTGLPGEVFHPHVLTLLNFHGPYNPYEPPPTATTCGKLSMTLKTSQMLFWVWDSSSGSDNKSAQEWRKLVWFLQDFFHLFVCLRPSCGFWCVFKWNLMSSSNWWSSAEKRQIVHCFHGGCRGAFYWAVPKKIHTVKFSHFIVRHPHRLPTTFLGLSTFPRMPCNEPPGNMSGPVTFSSLERRWRK